MPQFGLGFVGGKEKNRTADTPLEYNFNEDSVEDFTGSNATISTTASGLTTRAIKVSTTAGNGYAYKECVVMPSTEYRYYVKMVTAQTGSGNKSVAFGTSAGDTTNLGWTVENTPGQAVTGTFTTGASQTACFVGLKIQTSGKFACWDDLILEENI